MDLPKRQRPKRPRPLQETIQSNGMKHLHCEGHRSVPKLFLHLTEHDSEACDSSVFCVKVYAYRKYYHDKRIGRTEERVVSLLASTRQQGRLNSMD